MPDNKSNLNPDKFIEELIGDWCNPQKPSEETFGAMPLLAEAREELVRMRAKLKRGLEFYEDLIISLEGIALLRFDSDMPEACRMPCRIATAALERDVVEIIQDPTIKGELVNGW